MLPGQSKKEAHVCLSLWDPVYLHPAGVFRAHAGDPRVPEPPLRCVSVTQAGRKLPGFLSWFLLDPRALGVCVSPTVLTFSNPPPLTDSLRFYSHLLLTPASPSLPVIAGTMGEGVEGWSPVFFTYHLPQSELLPEARHPPLPSFPPRTRVRYGWTISNSTTWEQRKPVFQGWDQLLCRYQCGSLFLVCLCHYA